MDEGIVAYLRSIHKPNILKGFAGLWWCYTSGDNACLGEGATISEAYSKWKELKNK